ncbi:hypothetical protein [Glaciibacter superstes]|uniref:hypothetical protein n=1 Tax=Glaciibacter superstes TaxID=501023 RepID=UPI00316AC878
MPRLRRSDTTVPGITRVRSGRGFSYRSTDGRTIDDVSLRARLKALSVPPAWTDVWIAPFPNGHIQATGHVTYRGLHRPSCTDSGDNLVQQHPVGHDPEVT